MNPLRPWPFADHESLSRQERYQKLHEATHLCRSCPCAAEGLYCDACRAQDRDRSRNRYRKLYGIPLDAPVKRTRPRG